MRFAFRADGSSTIGLGHIMRCLCLAEALKKEGFNSFFISKNYGETVLTLIRSKGFELEALPAELSLAEDLCRTLKTVKEKKADAVIVDSYSMDETYLKKMKQPGTYLISIDDKAKVKLPSDLVINCNLGVSFADYPNLDKSRILLGPSYAILRSEFKETRTVRSFEEKAKKVLISFGGSNTSDLVKRIIQILLQVPELQITAIGLESLDGIDQSRVEIKKNTGNMAELMADADLGILSAGTIAWEAACMGLPAILIQIADNQQKNAEELDKLGISVNAGPAKSLNDSKLREHFQKLLNSRFEREKRSASGQKLVDGAGAARIVSEIKKRMVYEKN